MSRGEACPTCEQVLTPEAANRLANAEQFVSSELRRRATVLEEELQQLLAAIPDTDGLETRVASELRGAPDEVIAAGASAVSAIAALADRARVLAVDKQVDDFPVIVDLALIETYATNQSDAALAQAALRDVERQHEVVRALAELRARRTLHEGLPALKQRIETLKQIAVLEAAAGKLGTSPISNQLRKLQEAEITERLRTAIQEELQHTTLGPKIEVVGHATKGETKIQLRLAKSA